MAKRILLATTAIVGSLLFTGCATIFKGANQTVTINSKPDGARVSIDNVEVGVTPYIGKLKKGRSEMMTIEKEGYTTISRPFEKEFDAIAIIGTSTYSLPLIVDLAGGAAYEYMPNSYHFELKQNK